MSEIAIRVEGLGKQYRLGQTRERYATLRDRIHTLASPRVWFRSAAGRSTSTDFWALKDISFEVKRGDVVGIIGRNGAGKSTLLKILSRITEPTEGEADLHGRVGSLLEVGTGFHPELTGRENIFLNGAILGMKRAETIAKFDEIVAFAEVEKFIDTPVKHYSSGMYMRLAFAVAAHLEPEILIVDEVLAVGDGAFQKKCLGKMGEVARQGRTVLFVSHNMAAVQTLCNKAIWMRAGRLASSGQVDQQIASYHADTETHAGRQSENLRLSANLVLQHLTFRPAAVVSGESVDFSLSLRTEAATRLNHLCLLVHSPLNVRVAIIDLRAESGPFSLGAGGALTVQGSIDRLNLVEGEYRIGVYLVAGDAAGDFFDLAYLPVTSRPSATGIVPYDTCSRGLVEWLVDRREVFCSQE